MNKSKTTIITLLLSVITSMSIHAQHVLTLDSCKALAIRNNKQLVMSRVRQDLAANVRQAARTQYLPKVDALAGYEWTSREISILNTDQKNALSHLGTKVVEPGNNMLTDIVSAMLQQQIITPQMAQEIGKLSGDMSSVVEQAGNQFGQKIRDAFRTDTRNIWAGSVMVRQPIYMGGAITAANRMADIGEELACNDTDMRMQATLTEIEEAYWLVVKLRQKQKLANSFFELVSKLDSDVHKMIDEGVATRADGLKVDVKVNEAEMMLTQAEDGVALSRMLLCQLCGLPIDEDVELADENSEQLLPETLSPTLVTGEVDNRPELRMLRNMIDISKEGTKLIGAQYKPHIALTGGYLISNPNTFNGFERKFSGVWNVGVLMHVPIWSWHAGRYKMQASRAATKIAELEYSDLSEKISLQVEQCRFKVKEAYKKLTMTRKNISSAEENLRCANVGFQEGVMEATDVMAAQTAWQQAHTERIEAEIGVKLAELSLRKALGQSVY